MDSRPSVRIPALFRFVLSVVCFFLCIFLAQSIAKHYWPVDENNVLQAPVWYAIALFVTSILIAVQFSKFMKKHYDSPDSANYNSSFSLFLGQVLRFLLCSLFFFAFSGLFWFLLALCLKFILNESIENKNILFYFLLFSVIASFFIARTIWKLMDPNSGKGNKLPNPESPPIHCFNLDEYCPASASDVPPVVPADPEPVQIILPSRKAEIEKLLKQSISLQNSAVASRSVSSFSDYWNSSIEKLEEAENLIADSNSDDYQTIQHRLSLLRKNYLWKFRDAIEREESAVLSDAVGEYRNNKRGRCADFAESIMAYWDNFDDETRQFARESIQRISSRLYIPIQLGADLFRPEPQNTPAPFIVNERKMPPDVAAQLSAIDEMDGIQFEHWCADLLSKNGFINVSVTQPSNDQGADILAQKDGIKYCIQCKRYNSPLGNAPVQEIHSARDFYRRQVGAVITNCYFTSGAKKLARETGTLLWDRDWIKTLLEATAQNSPS